MNSINKFIVLTVAAALMIATLVVTASDQAYAEVFNIIIGSDVGQQNSGDTVADGGASSGEGDGPSTANGGTVGAGDLEVN